MLLQDIYNIQSDTPAASSAGRGSLEQENYDIIQTVSAINGCDSELSVPDTDTPCHSPTPQDILSAGSSAATEDDDFSSVTKQCDVEIFTAKTADDPPELSITVASALESCLDQVVNNIPRSTPRARPPAWAQRR